MNVLVRIRNVVNGASVTAERVDPDGKPLWNTTNRWTGTFSLGWGSFFIPIPGTPNEERLGRWKVIVRLDGGETREVPFTIAQADRALLETLKAEVQRSPDSFTPNYRLGVAASMFGDDALAVAQLKKAADISRTSVYARLALGRHYLKRGMKAEANLEFLFARGLLMGLREEGFAAWLQQIIEEYLKQVQ